MTEQSNKPENTPYNDMPWYEDPVVKWARERLLTGNPMAKIGVMVFFIGMAFFIKYATENHLLVLSIEIRHAIVALSGLVMLLSGLYLSPTKISLVTMSIKYASANSKSFPRMVGEVTSTQLFWQQ